MRAHLAALGDGVVLVADRQTAGKGAVAVVFTCSIGLRSEELSDGDDSASSGPADVCFTTL